jgi:putative membrane protein
MALFASQAEADRVAERVAAAERGTAGEIVVAVARRSSDYGAQRALFSLAWTLGWALVGYFALPQLPELWLLYAELPLALLGWWLSGLPAILRACVPRAARQAAVHARAQQLFVEQGVTETRGRSGVLLFLSESEQRLELLADRGIHERVGTEVWQSLVTAVGTAIHAGHAADGVCAAVDAIGRALAQHFPPEPGDDNELPDAPQRV